MKDMKRLINMSDGDIKEAWIGLYDQTNGTRTWYWSLPGLEFNESETNWSPGEPTDTKSEDCVTLYQNLKWIDQGCKWSQYFLCYDETNKTHKYHLIREKKSWLEAQSYCREKHTDLISGTKQLQDEEVKEVMKTTESKSFIGLFRDTWRWSDGSSFSFRHWNLHFNNQKLNRTQCAMNVFDDGGRWKNENCDERKPFICYDDKLILIKENKTWHEALTYCRQNHSDLVTITNMDEQRWIEEKTKNASTEFVWIGLRYNCTLKVWFWLCNNWAWDEQDECNKFGAMEAGGEHQLFKRNGSERFNFFCTN
ncbi:C-type mannose receptor 2-like isoform X6 [Poeciliopsis prolifica]|uniref:C-type mannose receptor 2-like isoform X6 n=1 Tax=Poeciliopsis prolifica TaxID=188132 RepID=UPI00241426CB|nr:C-type mannose receptor 2-like isoform X6 [Poeciliopsis prolifica]